MILRAASWDATESRIRRVPQYAACRSLRECEFPPARLMPLCKTVRTYRLRRVEELVAGYRHGSIALFRSVLLESDRGGPVLIPPPIIERHASSFVVVDGLHRVYLARALGERAIVVALAQGGLEPLPGAILAWEQIEVRNRHTRRSAKFLNFEERHFRDIPRVLDHDTPGSGPR